MKKKKIFILSIILLVIIIFGFFLITGALRIDVYLKDFELSNDGKKIILEVETSNDAGYIRKLKVKEDENNKYITFYQTFGINSNIGSKDTFEIELNDTLKEIYFYKGNDKYRLELVKNPVTKKWEKVNYPDKEVLKLNLYDKEDIIKIAINTGKQDNNYFEYDNKNTIDKIYNIFNNLKTNIPSTTFNPIEYEDMYTIIFFNNDDDLFDILLESDNNVFKKYVEVYRKDGKYYVEQRYNGIYQITENDFNLIKSYVK